MLFYCPFVFLSYISEILQETLFHYNWQQFSLHVSLAFYIFPFFKESVNMQIFSFTFALFSSSSPNYFIYRIKFQFSHKEHILNIFLFIFKEWRREGEREREKPQSERETSVGYLCIHPDQGQNPQPRHVCAQKGIKPSTFVDNANHLSHTGQSQRTIYRNEMS